MQLNSSMRISLTTFERDSRVIRRDIENESSRTFHALFRRLIVPQKRQFVQIHATEIFPTACSDHMMYNISVI